jgi:hypothetical protein
MISGRTPALARVEVLPDENSSRDWENYGAAYRGWRRAAVQQGCPLIWVQETNGRWLIALRPI